MRRARIAPRSTGWRPRWKPRSIVWRRRPPTRALLPGDDSSEGFDNMASVLSVSPALMQAYVSAAAKISRLAVGDPTISADLTTYQAPRGVSQAAQPEGLPL